MSGREWKGWSCDGTTQGKTSRRDGGKALRAKEMRRRRTILSSTFIAVAPHGVLWPSFSKARRWKQRQFSSRTDTPSTRYLPLLFMAQRRRYLGTSCPMRHKYCVIGRRTTLLKVEGDVTLHSGLSRSLPSFNLHEFRFPNPAPAMQSYIPL